jgi:hypothetical protein
MGSRRLGASLLFAGLMLELVGCGPTASGWWLSYDEAQRAAQAQNQTLLVFYKNPFDPESGRMESVLELPAIRAQTRGMLRCMLLTEFEPNRRFVAQYRQDRAPALIVIHPDGTYHARGGPLSPEDTAQFLQSAAPPGSRPTLNPALPRTYEYRWINIYEDAVQEARRKNRKLLIVYKWWLSSESNELIRRIDQPEVARHFVDSVHCILDWDFIPNRQHAARYGVEKLPALILVQPDGTYDTLVGLHEISRIVRFAVESRGGQRSAPRGGT